MERRLFYSAPDLETAQKCQSIAQEMHLADDNFSVYSLNSAELQSRKLPTADYLKTLDLPRCSFRGLAYGFAGGAALITMLEIVQSYSFDIHAQYYWVPLALTSFFGLWLGIMTGLAKSNHHLEPFKNKLAKGGSIIMLDVSEERAGEVEAMMAQYAPKAKFEKSADLVETLFDRTG